SHPARHSFPTRRSSDLVWAGSAAIGTFSFADGVLTVTTQSSFVGHTADQSAGSTITYSWSGSPSGGAFPSWVHAPPGAPVTRVRSEEHTSELQSPDHLV